MSNTSNTGNPLFITVVYKLSSYRVSTAAQLTPLLINLYEEYIPLTAVSC